MKVKQEGEIIMIDKLYDEATCTHFWRVDIYFEEVPDLKLGKCEVTQ